MDVSDNKALLVDQAITALKHLVGKERHEWPEFSIDVGNIFAKLPMADLERLRRLFEGASPIKGN